VGMVLKELAERIGAQVRPATEADAGRTIERCATLAEAGADDLAFLANPKYAQQLQTTRAGAVIVGPDVSCDGRTLLVADDPYFAFRNAVVALHGFREHPAPSDAGAGPQRSEKAVIDPSARLGDGCVVHPYAVICADVRIGRNCVVYPHVFIGPGTRIGDDCQIYPGVTIYDHCVIGDRVTLHAGCVIGQDGFGYATHDGAHHKIPQAGNVVIEDDVEMGAGCAVDRATIGSTVIGRGTKFSDQVAIGHGTKVGSHNLFVAQVGLAGSVQTGDHVVMGGKVGVAGHLKIGSGVRLAAISGVMSDIPDNAEYGGAPAMPWSEARRVLLNLQRLPALVDRVKKLEREIDRLRREVEK